MKSFFSYLIRLILFWLFVFFAQRQVFIFTNIASVYPIAFSEVFKSNLFAFKMDTATISYIMVIPLLLYIIWFFRNFKWIQSALNVYFITLIILTTFITIVDTGLFQAWGTKINPKAISYLEYPKEVVGSTKSSPILLLLFLYAAQVVLFIYIYIRFINRRLKKLDAKFIFKIVFPILSIGLLVIGIRGGFKKFPINASWSYYTAEPLLNQSAVNSSWSFIKTLTDTEEITNNPYIFFDKQTEEKLVASLYADSDSTTFILTNKRPNIVLIMLESFSAKIIGALNPEYIEATPYFNKMADSGLLFTRFYATGTRTEQGLTALLTGFPAQPRTTITRKTGKFEKLPVIFKDLRKNGYYTTYICAGDVNFSNTRAFLQVAECGKILSEDNIPSIKQKSEWGAYDEELFSFAKEQIALLPQPFFSIIVTATNHEPFEAKVENKFGNTDLKNKFLNTVYYTDQCLGNFFESVKNEDWYQHTLFILVSDHSHTLPNKRSIYDPERFQVPFLLYGNVLAQKYKGKQENKAASHADFPKTILAQLSINASHFKWGKNIFNPYQEGFAFFTFDEGFGFVKNSQTVVYDDRLKSFPYIQDTTTLHADNSIINQGKALLQKLMDEYVSY